MDKIIGSIFAFILAANTYTVAYSENTVEEKKRGTNITTEIEENISLENLAALKSPITVAPVNTTSWWKYPSEIKGVTKNGNDLLVLVNKEYKLPSTYAPPDLVSVCTNIQSIRCVNNTDFLLRNIIIEDLRSLADAARNDGIDLSVRSAYRSYNTQASTYNYWLGVNGGNVATTDTISARSGHSQHQLGTAVDFSSSEINDGLGGTFATTKASKWLADNAWKYGFVISYPAGYESVTGYSYESWHYRYIGKSNAQEMINSGMILELYLRSKN